MNKNIRELANQIKVKYDEANKAMEAHDIEAANKAMDELDVITKEIETLERLENAKKGLVPEQVKTEETDGFKMLSKMLNKQALNETEKSALISGASAQNGENYLIPEDVNLEINEYRKSYVSARDIITVERTSALTGSINWEASEPAGLAALTDGEEITEETAPKFVRKSYTIAFFAKIIPISRILQGAEKADLMGYINRWFLRNAVITENAKIFDTLKAGYNDGTPKAVAGWKALKKSLAVDLDPNYLIGAHIVTNQSGFAALDAEEDNDGRPVLQANPAHPTEKLFQGLPVKVFPDSVLANIDATHFPVFYGNTKAGATMKEYQGLEFAVSEHFYFNKNQNALRVIEGFTVMSTDTSSYIYGSFSATVSA